MTTSDIPLEDLKPHLAGGRRAVGLDLGSKTIGIAISDITARVANPLKTIRRRKFTQDAEELLQICEAENAGALIIGLPLNMNGTEGPRVQSTRAFVRNLRKHTEIAISYWDERLSTAAVTRTLLEADTSRKKRAEVVDMLAAAYILQGALDRLSSMDDAD